MCCAGGPRGEDALRHVDEYEGISSLMSAPSGSVLTACDEEHLVTYLRLLDADVEGADWREVARVVLNLDPENESDRARRAFESPFIARQMDDGARLPAPATRRHVRLKRPCYVAPLRAGSAPYWVAIRN